MRQYQNLRLINGKKHGLKKPSWFSKGTYPPKKPPAVFLLGSSSCFRWWFYTENRAFHTTLHDGQHPWDPKVSRNFEGWKTDGGRWQRPSIGSSEKYVCVCVFFLKIFFSFRAGQFIFSNQHLTFLLWFWRAYFCETDCCDTGIVGKQRCVYKYT